MPVLLLLLLVEDRRRSLRLLHVVRLRTRMVQSRQVHVAPGRLLRQAHLLLLLLLPHPVLVGPAGKHLETLEAKILRVTASQMRRGSLNLLHFFPPSAFRALLFAPLLPPSYGAPPFFLFSPLCGGGLGWMAAEAVEKESLSSLLSRRRQK